MEVRMRSFVPGEFARSKPIKTYETRFLYTGFSRYDIQKKTVSNIFRRPDGRTFYTESPCEETAFSRAYAAELVRITVYSENPKVWKEETSPHETHFFQQVTTAA
jgi:hypothetical protein